MTERVYAAIEGVGAKFLAAALTEDGHVLAQARIPTTTPQETHGAVGDFFDERRSAWQEPAGAGIACFGPLELNRNSPGFGAILKLQRSILRYQVRTGSHGATDLSPVCLGAALHFDTWVPNFGI